MSIVHGRLTLSCLAMVVCLAGQARANPQVACAVPGQGLKIDGRLGDWPAQVYWYPIAAVLEEEVSYSFIGMGPLSQPDDLSGRFASVYDSTTGLLYLAVEISDESDVVDATHPGDEVAGLEEWFRWDGCEVYLDPTDGKQPGRVEQHSVYGGRPSLSVRQKQITVARVRRDHLTVYEWAFRMDSDRQEQGLRSGRTVGFDISVPDRDRDGTFSWVSWTPGGSKRGSPGRIGHLRLLARADLGQLSTRVAIEKATGDGLENLATYTRLVSVQVHRAGKDAAQDVADSAGACIFHLQPGSYTVRAWAPGVQDTAAIDTVVVVEGTARQVHLLLRDRGRVFYIDAAADSTGPGTREAPFSRLARIAKVTSPGDTVRVAAGTYSEKIEASWGLYLIGAGSERTHLIGEHAGVTIANARGGAIRDLSLQRGTGISILNCRQFVVEGNVILGNQNDLGGGISVGGSSDVLIARNLIARNQARAGGGMFVAFADSTVRIEDNVIVANTASYRPDAPGLIVKPKGINDGIGAAIYTMGSPTIRHNTIVLNHAAHRGGGIVASSPFVAPAGAEQMRAVPWISGNIVAYNANGGVFAWYQAAPDLGGNDVWNNGAWDYLGTPPGREDFSADPQFLDLAGGNLALATLSPCRSRPDGARGQVGAEITDVQWVLTPAHLPPADTIAAMSQPQVHGPTPVERYHPAAPLQGMIENAGLPRQQFALDSLSTRLLNREVTFYTTKDGLAGDMVLDIQTADDGAMWFATTQGVSRFDGTWRSYTVADGLASPMVFGLCLDREGQLWCATQAGLSRYDGRDWVTYFAGQTVTSVATDSTGRVWGAKADGEVFCHHAGEWHYYLLPVPVAIVALVDMDNRVWFKSPVLGLLRFDGTEFRQYSADAQGDALPIGLTQARDHSYWYSHMVVQPQTNQFSSQISRLDSTGWIHYVLPSSLTGYMALGAVEDPQGGLWVPAMRGLLFFDGQQWYRVAEWDGLPPNLGIAVSADGTLWIATQGGGVARIGKPRWAGLEAVAGQRIAALQLDDQGALWRATDDGLRRLSADGQDQVLRRPDGLLSDRPSALCPDGQGGLWVGSDAGLNHYHPEQGWRTQTAADGMPAGAVQALLALPTGGVWAGTSAGLGRYDGKGWQRFGAAEGLDTPDVLSLWQDNDTTLWVGTRGGAFVVQGGRIANLLGALHPLLRLDIYSLAAQTNPDTLDAWMRANLSNDRVFAWLAAKLDEVAFRQPDGGARLLEACQRWVFTDTNTVKQLEKITRLQSGMVQDSRGPGDVELVALATVGNRPVTAIRRDQGGRLWFGTEAGAFVLTDTTWARYTTADGLADNRVQQLGEDRQGRLWFLGPGGATRYDGTTWVTFNQDDGLPDNQVLSLVEDRTGAMIFGTARGVKRLAPDRTPPNTDITEGPAGVHAESQVLFRYQGGDAETAPGGLTYAHAFTPAGASPKEEDWSAYTRDTLVREAFLDGDYTFQVRARDKEGNVDPSPATRSFTIRTEELVQIAQIEVDPIFPAIYRWYANHRLGRVKLANKGSAPLKVVLRLEIPEFMDVPTTQEVVLPPAAITEVDLQAVFAERVAAVTKGRQTPIHIELIYRKDDSEKKTKRSSTGMVHGRNALTWQEPRVAAAFVTSTEEGLNAFAREVSRQQRSFFSKGVDRYLTRAMVLFDALGAAGLRYVQDANTPYAQVAAGRTAVDNIQYPAEFLASRTGDCDDCTVLYCALLENLGIRTAIVDAPGHVFMAFDSGVDVESLELLCLEPSQYVVHQGRAWIPVEVTVLGESFAKAWQLGAEAVSYLGRAGQLQLIPVSQAWEEYPPAEPTLGATAAAPDSAGTAERVPGDLDELVLARDTFLQRHYLLPLRRNPADHALRSELARLYVYLDRTTTALAEYQQLLANGYQPAGTHNDLGIALMVAGDAPAAAEHFAQAVRLEPDDRGFQRNHELALARLQAVSAAAVVVEVTKAPGETKGSIPFIADQLIWATRPPR